MPTRPHAPRASLPAPLSDDARRGACGAPARWRSALLPVLALCCAACTTPSGRRLGQDPLGVAVRASADATPDSAAPDSAALAAALARDAAVPDSLFHAGAFTSVVGVRLLYRLLPPPDVRPGIRYPLVLVLHGSDAIGGDNAAQLGAFARSWAAPDLRARFPAYVLVPQFPARSAVYTVDAAGAPTASRPTPAANAALALVDTVIARHPVDRGRVYVVGFSMGGSTAWQAAAAEPARFAAAVPIAGIAPDPADGGAVARLVRVPLFVVHGTADTENPIGPDRAMVATLRRVGAPHLRVWEVARLGHRVPPTFFTSDAWRAWLFAQRR